MTPRKLTAALYLLFAVIFLLAAPASAQQIVSAKDATEAKRHFEVGLRLFNEHATAQALVEFQQSYQLGGRASALRNIAQCQRDLQQFTEAYKSYTLLKDKHGKELSPADAAAVDRALGELAVLTGTLRPRSRTPFAPFISDARHESNESRR